MPQTADPLHVLYKNIVNSRITVISNYISCFTIYYANVYSTSLFLPPFIILRGQQSAQKPLVPITMRAQNRQRKSANKYNADWSFDVDR